MPRKSAQPTRLHVEFRAAGVSETMPVSGRFERRLTRQYFLAFVVDPELGLPFQHGY
jgi:hypothetical protein